MIRTNLDSSQDDTRAWEQGVETILNIVYSSQGVVTHPEERDVDDAGGHVGGYHQAAAPVLGAGGGQVAGHLHLRQVGGEQRQGAGEGAIGGGLVTVRRSEEVSRGTAHLVPVTLVRDGATLRHLAEPPANNQSGEEEQCLVR